MSKIKKAGDGVVEKLMAELKQGASRATLDGMARYGLPSDRAIGVPVGVVQKIAKAAGRDHDVSLSLWETGVYEARLLAAYVGEPDRVTATQMDRWCRDFDNWGLVDTICFVLFDRTPLAWTKVRPWIKLKGEFQRRAGYVLMACLAAHDKAAPDAKFLPLLPLIEKGAADERNFVKKGVSWALRMIGRRSPMLRAAALPVAQRLAESENVAARWVGRHALRQFKS